MDKMDKMDKVDNESNIIVDQVKIMTEAETVIYTINSEQPLTIVGIDDLALILSMVINNDESRIKNVIFDTSKDYRSGQKSPGDKIYCNSYDKVYKMVINERMFDNIIHILYSVDSRLKIEGYVINIYARNVKWTLEDLDAQSLQYFANLDERFEDTVSLSFDFYGRQEINKIYSYFIPCILAMKNKNIDNRMVFKYSHNSLYIDYRKVTDSLILYHQYCWGNTGLMQMCGKLGTHFNKIIFNGYKIRLTSVKV